MLHRKILVLLALLCISISSFAQNLSNRGREFWVAWGHNQLGSGATFKIYLSTTNQANVDISFVGGANIYSNYIPPNSVVEVNVPYNGGASMLSFTDGINDNKAIRITADEPIVAYTHMIGSASSGATMLLPVETWGQRYFSMNSAQDWGSGARSWVYVIANQDSTYVELTPTVQSTNTSANTPLTIMLMRGQIYNMLANSLTDDMSGTQVRSVNGPQGQACKPIAVFSGTSRTRLGSSGDFAMQQIFPAQAWGTRYLSAPASSLNSTATRNPTPYRIFVRDPSTVVRVNGAPLNISGLIRNTYYEVAGVSTITQPITIEADKPISVAQYFPSQGSTGWAGNGDPETIILSPIEQAIKSVGFMATENESMTGNFVQVIARVPNVALTGQAAANSINLRFSQRRGANPIEFQNWDVVYDHNLTGYKVFIKRFSPNLSGAENRQAFITSDSAFTGITYGLGSVESYGYNVGTLVNNLDALGNIQNTGGSNQQLTTRTCRDVPFRFTLALPYVPTQIRWLFSQVPRLSDNVDSIQNNPVPIDSFIQNNRRYYRFSVRRDYTFDTIGTITIPLKIVAPGIDNCQNTADASLQVVIERGPFANFVTSYTGCRLDTAFFNSNVNANGFNIERYKWFYPNGSVDSLGNTSFFRFDAPGTYPVRLRAIADNGCYGDTTINVVTAPNPYAAFAVAPDSICIGSNFTFTDSASFAGTVPVSRFWWSYGDGRVDSFTTRGPRQVRYDTAGLFTVRYVNSASRCNSDTATRTIRVWQKPDAWFGFTTGCLQDSTVRFFDSTRVTDGQTFSYAWNFGDPNPSPTRPNTSTVQNPSHIYVGFQVNDVQLIVTTNNGCRDTVVRQYQVQGFSSPITFTVANENRLCSNLAVNITNTSNIAQDSIYRIDQYWDVATQPTVFVTDNTPTQGEVYTHTYATFTTPATLNKIIKWVVYSRGGCISEKFDTITLHALPVLSIGFIPGRCVNGGISSIDSARVTNGVTGNGWYIGNGIDSAGRLNPAIAGIGVNSFKYYFSTNGGCLDSISASVRVFPKPNAQFTRPANRCLGDSTLLVNTSTISSGNIVGWNWNFGDNSTPQSFNNGNPFYHTYRNFGSFVTQLTVVSDSGCVSDVYRDTAKIDPLPEPNFSIPPFICMPAGKAAFTNLSTIANGTTSQLTYTWNFGDGGTSNETDPTYVYSNIGPYNVRLTARSVLGCVKDTVRVLNTFYEQPRAGFTVNDSIFCQGKETIFTDTSTAPNSTITDWFWSFGDGSVSTERSPRKTYTQYGPYTVTLVTKNTQGCLSDTATKNIRVNLQPRVNAGPDLVIDEGRSGVLRGVINDPGVRIVWTPATYLSSDTVVRPTVTPLFNTVYIMYGYGDGNCMASDTVRVTVLKQLRIPNAFSPNGDGINDKWVIPYIEDYPNLRMQVFNRYGQPVFTSNGYAKPWDGNGSGGQPLPAGTYYYIIEPNGGGYDKLSGYVLILR